MTATYMLLAPVNAETVQQPYNVTASLFLEMLSYEDGYLRFPQFQDNSIQTVNCEALFTF